MKNIHTYLIISLLLMCTTRLQAQVLSVASGTDFNVAAGTVVGADSLDITPTANFTLNGTSLSHNTTASNAVSFPYIGSVYQFSNTTNPFSGSLQFVYNNATLNSIPTIYLSQHIHDGSSWNTEPVAALNTGNTYLQTSGLNGISLNELTLATPPTWTGTASSNWATATNWVSNYVPISTSNAVIQSSIPYNPAVSTNETINGLTINSGANLTIANSLSLTGDINNGGIITAPSGTVVLNGTAAQNIYKTSITNDSIKNLTINNNAGVALGGPLYVTGRLTPTSGTLNTGGNLVLVSTNAGTARIATGSGSYIAGNVTVQRYIPAKTARRFSFIASPVVQTIRNAWQQQMYITGKGNGGVACGTTNGDGGTTDKYNSNGFDATTNNAATLTYYTAATVGDSHYVGVANTESTNLTPGIGYSVNVRGDRSSTTVSCANQLGTTAPSAPEAVTLSATGPVSTGNQSVTLNDPAVSAFTLVGNPYPSQISLSAVANDASNSSLMYYKMWTYSPFITSGNFTTYSQGTIVNAISGFDDTNGDYIASGQAFFVQAKTTGSITFKESHKSTGTVPNTQYFGANNNKLIRLGIYTTTGSKQDETAIRFNVNGSKVYNPEWDAQSLSSGSQTLASLKNGLAYAIATRPDAKSDTINLQVKSKATGTFSLKATDIAGFDSLSAGVLLKDNFWGVTQELLTVPNYTFNITTDTLSKGANRFQILINGNNTLPISFINVSGSVNDGIATIHWSIANANDSKYYKVEKSTDGNTFSSIATVVATKATNYSAIDANLIEITNYYRIKAVSAEGKTVYSKTIQLNTKESKYVKVYPTLITDKRFTVELNNMSAGNYEVVLFNMLGQTVLRKAVANNAAFSKLPIVFAGDIAAGSYEVTVVKEGILVKQSRVVVR